MQRDPEEIKELQFHRAGTPPIWTKGEGVWLVNDAGERFLDASGGPMVVNIGHGRSEIADVAAEQIKTLAYTLPSMIVESRLKLTEQIQKYQQNINKKPEKEKTSPKPRN